jgi:hypothetical protein
MTLPLPFLDYLSLNARKKAYANSTGDNKQHTSLGNVRIKSVSSDE